MNRRGGGGGGRVNNLIMAGWHQETALMKKCLGNQEKKKYETSSGGRLCQLLLALIEIGRRRAKGEAKRSGAFAEHDELIRFCAEFISD